MKEIKQVESIGNRISYALSVRGMKPVDLVNKTGISKASISQYISGYSIPKADRIFVMAKALGVDESWLMGFDAPMERAKIKEVNTDVVADFIMDEDARNLVECYNQLGKEDRMLIWAMMKKMI